MGKNTTDEEEIGRLSEQDIEDIVSDRLLLEDIDEDELIDAAIEMIDDIKENFDISRLSSIIPNKDLEKISKKKPEQQQKIPPGQEAPLNGKYYTYKDLWKAADSLYYIDKESFARILFTMRARKAE